MKTSSREPRDPGTGSPGPVILFDGRCAVCVRSVRLVLRSDRTEIFRFAALESPVARKLLEACRADPADLEAVRAGQSLGLVAGGRLHVRSEAALRIAASLPWPWKLASCLKLFPRHVRDRAYSAVARRRHALARRIDACPLPDEGTADRFL